MTLHLIYQIVLHALALVGLAGLGIFAVVTVASAVAYDPSLDHDEQ